MSQQDSSFYPTFLDSSKKLIRSSVVILGYYAVPLAESQNISLSPSNQKQNFCVNVPVLSDVPIIMNSRCPEFTLKIMSKQLQSSFGSLNMAHFRAEQLPAKILGSRSIWKEKWVQNEYTQNLRTAGSQKTHYNLKHTNLIMVGKIQQGMHTCSTEHFHTGGIFHKSNSEF